MIKIGDYWGAKYDYISDLLKYIRFRFQTNIKLVNWEKCMEAIEDPFMYIQEGFIPSTDNLILDISAQYGDYAMILEKKYNCRVFSFEIAPENFEYLQENILINRSGVRGYNNAIGNGEEINFEFKIQCPISQMLLGGNHSRLLDSTTGSKTIMSCLTS